MTPPNLLKTLAHVWPLLAGICMIMIGNGLQGTLLGLRASHEGFSPFATGIIMTLYYCGFLLGCFIVPKVLQTVGHIRVFAAMASLASTTILIHGAIIDQVTWAFVRIVSGFSFSGLFIVAESWLNNISPNNMRGQIFGSYLFVIYVGLFGGQFLLGLASYQGIELFLMISILVSLSMLPITLADKPAPGYEEPETLAFKDLLDVSPLAFTGVFVQGICASIIFGLSGVYGKLSGMSTTEIALFVGSYVLGSALLSVSTGWLSDHIDRRKIIYGLSLLGAISAALTSFTSFWYITIFFLGGFTTSLYSTSLALMNDQVESNQTLSATTTLIIVNTVGSCLGPVIMGYLMSQFGTMVFFPGLSAALLVITATSLYRILKQKPLKVEEQTQSVIFPVRSSPNIYQISEESEEPENSA